MPYIDRFLETAGNNGNAPPPIVQVDSRTRLYSDIRRKIFPSEIRGILQNALMGDLYWQDQLFATVFDGWPRAQKNLRELTSAVSRIDYVVTPYKERGARTPSKSAIAKADTVRRAIWAMNPVVTRGERDFEGLIKDIVEATLVGISVSEILWELRRAPETGALECMPRATQRVPALFYRYPFTLDQPDELLLNPSGELGGINLEPFPENKFVIGIYQGHSGHPSVTAPMRCLTSLWAANVFGLEWFATNAQLFGIPFRKGTFEKGDAEGYELLTSMLQQMGSAGWAALPKETDIEFIMAPGNGGVGPAERLVDLADRICDIFILGQTLSTDVGQSGSRALGEVHAGVKQDIIEAVADFSAGTLKQLVRAIVSLNFDNTDELPQVTPDIKDPQDELKMAQRDEILFAQMKLPVASQYLYERHNVPAPQTADALYTPPLVTLPATNFDAPKPQAVAVQD